MGEEEECSELLAQVDPLYCRVGSLFLYTKNHQAWKYRVVRENFLFHIFTLKTFIFAKLISKYENSYCARIKMFTKFSWKYIFITSLAEWGEIFKNQNKQKRWMGSCIAILKVQCHETQSDPHSQKQLNSSICCLSSM